MFPIQPLVTQTTVFLAAAMAVAFAIALYFAFHRNGR